MADSMNSPPLNHLGCQLQLGHEEGKCLSEKDEHNGSTTDWQDNGGPHQQQWAEHLHSFSEELSRGHHTPRELAEEMLCQITKSS